MVSLQVSWDDGKSWRFYDIDFNGATGGGVLVEVAPDLLWHGYTWGGQYIDTSGKPSSPDRFQLFRVTRNDVFPVKTDDTTVPTKRHSLMKPMTLNLNASTSPSMTPNCPPGPWHQTGRIDATDPLCGLSNDGVTESSAALAQCLQLAANCSGKTMQKMPIFFPPGAYWLARTVVFSAANGTTGMTLVGSGAGVSYLCKCANCSAGPSKPNFDQCGPSASGLHGPRGPVLQIGTPADEDGFGGVTVTDLTIRGVEIGVYIVNAPAVSMRRTQIEASGFDGGDMDAAMIISE